MLPVVRTFIALPAGISAMPLVRFHVYTFIGSWPWCFLLAWVGMVLGDKWGSDPRMAAVFHYADYAIAALVVIFVARFVWKRWERAATAASRRDCWRIWKGASRGSRKRLTAFRPLISWGPGVRFDEIASSLRFSQ